MSRVLPSWLGPRMLPAGRDVSMRAGCCRRRTIACGAAIRSSCSATGSGSIGSACGRTLSVAMCASAVTPFTVVGIAERRFDGLALGADRAAVIRMVLRGAAGMCAIGIELLPMGHKERQRALEHVIPPDRRYGLHVNLVAHGRTVCRAPAPACEVCVLASKCAHRIAQRGPPLGTDRRG